MPSGNTPPPLDAPSARSVRGRSTSRQLRPLGLISSPMPKSSSTQHSAPTATPETASCYCWSELARHDALAGRIVVQRLLPGLISAAAKYRFLSEAGDPAEEAVGAAWIAIRNYDVTRRTRHVAAAVDLGCDLPRLSARRPTPTPGRNLHRAAAARRTSCLSAVTRTRRVG